MTVKAHKHHELLHFGIFLMAAVLLFLLVKPVLIAFLTSVILAYVFYPVYSMIERKIKWKRTAAFITILLIILIILVPTSLFAYQVVQQISAMGDALQGNIAQGTVFGFTCKSETSTFCTVINKVDQFAVSKFSAFGLEKSLNEGLKKIVEISTLYLIQIPQAIFSTIVVLFITFYLLVDGKRMHDELIAWLPFKRKTSEKLAMAFDKTTYSVVFSQLVVAIVQGVAAIVGFYIFGVPSPVFLGIVLAFFALLPVLGAAVVWLPAAILLLVYNYVIGNYFGVAQAIGLMIYGTFIISMIDNVLRVKMVEESANVHPLVVIIGIAGGLALFGVMGVFIGPILLSLIFTYFAAYQKNELE